MPAFQPFGKGTHVFRDAMDFINTYTTFMTRGDYSTTNERFAQYCGTTPEKVKGIVERIRTQLNRGLALKRKESGIRTRKARRQKK